MTRLLLSLRMERCAEPDAVRISTPDRDARRLQLVRRPLPQGGGAATALPEALAPALRLGALARSAEMVGCAQRILELTMELRGRGVPGRGAQGPPDLRGHPSTPCTAHHQEIVARALGLAK